MFRTPPPPPPLEYHGEDADERVEQAEAAGGGHQVLLEPDTEVESMHDADLSVMVNESLGLNRFNGTRSVPQSGIRVMHFINGRDQLLDPSARKDPENRSHQDGMSYAQGQAARTLVNIMSSDEEPRGAEGGAIPKRTTVMRPAGPARRTDDAAVSRGDVLPPAPIPVRLASPPMLRAAPAWQRAAASPPRHRDFAAYNRRSPTPPPVREQHPARGHDRLGRGNGSPPRGPPHAQRFNYPEPAFPPAHRRQQRGYRYDDENDDYGYPHPQYRFISNAVRPFDGTGNVDTWIGTFRKLTGPLSEWEKTLVLSEKLTGRAGTWLQDQQAVDDRRGMQAAVGEWLLRLREHFLQTDSMRLSELSLRAQKKGESATVFCGDLQHLLMAYNPLMQELDQINWLRNLMHPDYRQAFEYKCPRKPNWTKAVEALAVAMDIDRRMKESATKSQAPPSTLSAVDQQAPANSNQFVEDVAEKVKALTMQQDSRGQNFRDRGRDRDQRDRRGYHDRRDRSQSWDRHRSQSRGSDRGSDRGRDYGRDRRREQTPGRVSWNDRRVRDRSNSSSDTRNLCFQCGGKGHRKADCASNPDSKNYVNYDRPASRSSGNE